MESNTESAIERIDGAVAHSEIPEEVRSSESSSSSDDSSSDSSGSSDSSDSSGSSSEESEESSDSSEADTKGPKRGKPARKAADAVTSSSRRKKKFRFLDVEADVGSGDEEDEEFIDDEGALREAREGGSGRESRELELLRREAEQRRSKSGGGNRLQSVIQRLEEQAARQKEAGADGMVEKESGVLAAVREEGEYFEPPYGNDDEFYDKAGAALFPTADDYKLFFVRMAEPGKERDAVVQLAHKAAAEKECLIRSVFSIDSLRGYIYIEAPSETTAKNFLMGIRKVQWYNVVVVPQSEMASVFRAAIEESREKFKQLQAGEFVRIKRHAVYKGDLARVVECYDRDVEVELVPRIDWGDSSGGRRAPVQNLFDDKAVEDSGEIERLRNPSTGTVRTHFKNEMFSDEGFIVKRFNRSSLLVGSAELVNPKLEELRWFNKGKDSVVPKLADGPSVIGSSVFSIGDVVKVSSGDLRNLVGKVVLIDKQKSILSIEPITTSSSVIQVLERDVHKYFKLSQHVKIIAGPSSGDSGLVTAANDNVYTILIDGEMREVQVKANSLERSDEISKGETRLGNYQLGQLVQFSKPIESVGLIVKIAKSGHFAILSVDGKRFSVSLSDIGGNKSSRDAVAVSRHGDVLKKGSVVKYFGDANLIKSGTIREIYRNALFIKENEKVSDAGISVIDCKYVELVAAQTTTSMTTSNYHLTNYTGGGAQTSQQQHLPSSNRRYGGGANRLEGKRVRIIKGQYKGELAQVREDHDTKVQVSLEAKFRVVTIPKDCVRLEDEEEQEHNNLAPTGNVNQPPVGSLYQPPQGYVPPSSTPYTPAPPHLSK